MVKYGGTPEKEVVPLSRPERSVLLVFLALLALAGGWAVWVRHGQGPLEPVAGIDGTGEVSAAPAAGDGSPEPEADPREAAGGGPAGAADREGGGTVGAPPVVVHIVGAVARPGVYALREGQRVADAVAAAGGPAGDARLDLINLAARLEDGQKIYVPSEKDARSGSGPPFWEAGGAVPGTPAKVSLNRAGVAELDTLPGIGPALAQRIVDYRRAHGPFRRIEDLQQVPGIGPAKFQEIRDRLTLD